MMYNAYHYSKEALRPLNFSSELIGKLSDKYSLPLVGRYLRANAEMIERFTKKYPKVPFGLDHTIIDDKKISVTEEVAVSKPFCDLIHFKRDGDYNHPSVIFVAPMAGHYASLLRGTLNEFLPDHEVYVTDWKNPRDIPLSEGDFGFDDFVSYIIDFIKHLGPDTHMVSACQPCPGVLAAVAVLAMQKDKNQLKSLTLMAGPVDSQINCPKIIKNMPKLSIPLLKKLVINRVPRAYAGRGRRVYAGFRQLSFFMSMNIKLHIKKHVGFYLNMLKNRHDESEAHRVFYDNYMSVMDGTETMYINTIQRVFYENQLPKGEMEYKGKLVDTQAIEKTALLTVEGENDEFCPPGQTKAAHTICSKIPKKMQGHHLQKGVGHYGVFAGSKFNKITAPLIKKFIQAAIASKPVPAELKL